jgi:hypothetical protein
VLAPWAARHADPPSTLCSWADAQARLVSGQKPGSLQRDFRKSNHDPISPDGVFFVYWSLADQRLHDIDYFSAAVVA